jgi:ribosomal protein L37AE/L43A
MKIKKKMLRKTVKGAENKIIVEKKFCPICGSDDIRKRANGRYRCLLCKALFAKPKKVELKLRKRPRYIG